MLADFPFLTFANECSDDWSTDRVSREPIRLLDEKGESVYSPFPDRRDLDESG